MAGIVLNPGAGGKIVETDTLINGRELEAVQPGTNIAGIFTPFGPGNPLNVIGTVTTNGLTDTELRASPVPVSGPLTDTQLRASPVPVSGTVTTNGLTDTELRATPVPVSGPLTDIQLRATPVPVSGPLTDIQLRATPVPVSNKSSTATRTSVTVTSVVTTVLASNANRIGATLYHDGAGNCFIALGSAATTTDFTIKLTADDYYPIPFGYTGIITAIRTAGTNPLRITELT